MGLQELWEGHLGGRGPVPEVGGGIRRKRNSEKEQVVFDLEDVLILP